jgi:RHS repeat-associated protein
VYRRYGFRFKRNQNFLDSLGVPEQDATVSYLTNDHLGSPRINTDRDGNVTARHDYHPFGEEITSGSRSSHPDYTPDGVRKQFTGKERDYEISLDYFDARSFSPSNGRFLSVDPIYITLPRLTDPQRINLYAYARGNPTIFTDPTGKDLVLKSDIKKDDADIIVEALVDDYMKTLGNKLIDYLEASKTIITFGIGDVKERPGSKPGEIAMGNTRINDDGNIEITLDFRKQEKIEKEATRTKDHIAGKIPHPRTKQTLVKHEKAHATDAIQDMEGYAADSDNVKKIEKRAEIIEEDIKS